MPAELSLTTVLGELSRVKRLVSFVNCMREEIFVDGVAVLDWNRRRVFVNSEFTSTELSFCLDE